MTRTVIAVIGDHSESLDEHGEASHSGASLVPLMTGAIRELGLETYSESMYPLHHFGWSDVRAMRLGRLRANPHSRRPSCPTIVPVVDRPPRPPRAETREIVELKLLK